MRRQDAATPGPTNQVFVGDAHGLRLPHKRFMNVTVSCISTADSYS